MSPTLFNICIDDLLELQTVCLQDGIMNALDRLVAMAYADDLKASQVHMLACSASSIWSKPL
jgi:hypothetical protein